MTEIKWNERPAHSQSPSCSEIQQKWFCWEWCRILGWSSLMEGSPSKEKDHSLSKNQIQQQMENRRNNESKQTVISKKGPVTRIAQNRVSFLSLFKCKLLWRTSLTICQWKQESSGSILVIATSTPVVRVVSTKLCPILEGDQRDSAIELITLLVESGTGVPVTLGVVEHLESLPSTKEIRRQHILGKWTSLDLLPLKHNWRHTLASHRGSEWQSVSPIVLVGDGGGSLSAATAKMHIISRRKYFWKKTTFTCGWPLIVMDAVNWSPPCFNGVPSWSTATIFKSILPVPGKGPRSGTSKYDCSAETQWTRSSNGEHLISCPLKLTDTRWLPLVAALNDTE